MKRALLITVCLAGSLLLLGAGWLIPAHLRAVDIGVIQAAGKGTPALVTTGQNFAESRNLGSAQMLLRAADAEHVPGRKKLADSVNPAMALHPSWMPLGGASPRLESVFGTGNGRAGATNVPFAGFVLRLGNVDRALEFLSTSRDPVIQDLLRCRSLTNLAIFSPSHSASGQAFDAALSICGLLVEEGNMTASLHEATGTLAEDALTGRGSEHLEQMLLDYLSLGQRFDWNQLQLFNARIEDAETLRLLANFVRQAEGREPLIFASVVLSERPAGIASYLVNFSRTGLDDLGRSLAAGQGGMHELLRRNLGVEDSPMRRSLQRYEPFATLAEMGTDSCWRSPAFALTLRWLLYLGAGLLLALAAHWVMPAPAEWQRPLQVRGAAWARQLLFALGFLLVVLLVSEPFLARESQKASLPFRLRLLTMGGAVPAGVPGAKPSFMNSPSTYLVMLLFFVLQALLYLACLVKLGEVRRQRVQARLKLKLLDNEDHLFDAGLYLGFLGTIVSLILASLMLKQQWNLMVAYSSTSFGIVFVSIFKIFHLRPLRRQLVMEAEVESGEHLAPVAATAAPTV